MSRFFSRLLIAPAVAGFFLFPHRGNAQENPESNSQSTNKEEIEYFLVPDSELDNALEKAVSQITDKIKEICQEQPKVNSDDLARIIEEAIEK